MNWNNVAPEKQNKDRLVNDMNYFIPENTNRQLYKSQNMPFFSDTVKILHVLKQYVNIDAI